jgi:hypothetical protein
MTIVQVDAGRNSHNVMSSLSNEARDRRVVAVKALQVADPRSVALGWQKRTVARPHQRMRPRMHPHQGTVGSNSGCPPHRVVAIVGCPLTRSRSGRTRQGHLSVRARSRGS